MECETGTVRSFLIVPSSSDTLWTSKSRAEFESMQQVSEVFYECNNNVDCRRAWLGDAGEPEIDGVNSYNSNDSSKYE